jgi:hypothetical protein
MTLPDQVEESAMRLSTYVEHGDFVIVGSTKWIFDAYIHSVDRFVPCSARQLVPPFKATATTERGDEQFGPKRIH